MAICECGGKCGTPLWLEMSREEYLKLNEIRGGNHFFDWDIRSKKCATVQNISAKKIKGVTKHLVMVKP